MHVAAGNTVSTGRCCLSIHESGQDHKKEYVSTAPARPAVLATQQHSKTMPLQLPNQSKSHSSTSCGTCLQGLCSATVAAKVPTNYSKRLCVHLELQKAQPWGQTLPERNPDLAHFLGLNCNRSLCLLQPGLAVALTTTIKKLHSLPRVRLPRFSCWPTASCPRISGSGEGVRK